MLNNVSYRIFKNGSKTYFYSSIFFPPRVKEDVFSLYAFLRTADDFVDTIPQKTERFTSFQKLFRKARKGNKTGNVVIDSFIELEERKSFEQEWADAFLKSMSMDLHPREYETMDSVEEYVFGSAEVVGLFMAKILNLSSKSHKYARLLGKSMQYLNFIRDISEDQLIQRNYFPQEDLRSFGLSSLSYSEVNGKQESFKDFMHKQLGYYYAWQEEAEKGFKFIPNMYLIPIKTASDMYKWTAEMIEKTPLIVYQRKIKPSIPKIVLSVGLNSVKAAFSA